MSAPPLPLALPTSTEEFLAYWIALLRERIRERGLRPRDVAAHIHVGESSLRKRLRGEVPFSAQEFVSLSAWLELPSCVRETAPGRLQLTASRTKEQTFSPEAYIGGFTRFNHDITLGVPRESVGLRICATDLPIHQVLGEPVLTALKLYFFATENGVRVTSRFSLADVLEEQAAVLEQALEVHRVYQSVGSVEVWGREPMGSFLQQVAKLARAGALTAPDTAAVFASLRATAIRISAEADAGVKAGGGAFRLHQHALFSNNAILLAESPRAKLSFLTLANPQFLYSDHGYTYDFLSETADALRRQARPVAGGSALDGARLGEQLLADIAKTEAAIEAYWAAEAMF